MNKNPFYTNPNISKQFLNVLKNRLKFFVKHDSLNILYPSNKHKLCFKKWKFECIKPKTIIEKKDRNIRMRTRIYVDNYSLNYNYNYNFIKHLNKKEYDEYRRKELLSLIGNIKENKKIKEFEEEKKNYDNIKRIETKEHKIKNDDNKKEINYNDLKILESIEENYKDENEKNFMEKLKNYNKKTPEKKEELIKESKEIEVNNKKENELNNAFSNYSLNNKNKYKRWYDIPEDKRLKAWCFLKILSFVSYERLQRKLREKYFLWKKYCGLDLIDSENQLHDNNF